MTGPVVICPNPDCPDLEATGTRGEYVSATEVCPYCGARLVDPGTIEAVAPGQAVDEQATAGQGMEPVFESEDSAEIAIVRTILKGAGIPSVTSHDTASDRVLPGFDPFRFMRGPRSAVFWVPADRADEARALLTEVDPEAGEPDADD